MKKKAVLFIIFIELFILCISYIPSISIVTAQVILYSSILALYFLAPKSFNYSNKKTSQIHVVVILLAVSLFFRIVVDLEFNGVLQNIYKSNYTVYFFYFNFIFLPVFFLPILDLKDSNIYSVLKIISFLLLVCLLFSINNILNSVAQLSVDGRFSANESLGTIQYGHLGVTVIMIGFTLMQMTKKTKLFVLYLFFVIVIGIATMMLAGTRSAYVSLFVCFFVYAISSHQKKILFYLVTFIASLFIFKSYILNIFDILGSNSAARFYNLFIEKGDVTSGRNELYNVAFNDVLENPILGKAYFFFYDSQSYVHNSILEMYRAIGIVGGTLFLYFNLYCLKITYNLIKDRSNYMFFALLYLQYFTYSLFSDTIIRIGMYWFSALFLICIKRNNDNKYKEKLCNH